MEKEKITDEVAFTENEAKQNEIIQLPENAFRELKEGENYSPVMSPDRSYPEVQVKAQH